MRQSLPHRLRQALKNPWLSLPAGEAGVINESECLSVKMMVKKGLSMLELIVSIFIFSLIMLGLVNVFVASRRYMISSRSQITAAELSRYFLGNLSLQVRQDQWGSNCLGAGANCNCVNMTVGNIVYHLENGSYNVTPNVWGTNLTRVKVNITWNEPAP